MTRQLKLSTSWSMVSLVSVLAAACSSGGGSGPGQAVGPSISSIPSQSINQDTQVGPLAFIVTAAPGPAGQLVVTASSSNQALVPDSNIAVSGSSSSRTIALTPMSDAVGTAEVRITAKDAQGRTAQGSFAVTVNPVYASFTSTTDAAYSASEDTKPVPLSGVTLQPDADDNANAFATLLQ